MSAEPLLRLIAGPDDRDTTGLIEVRCRNPRSGRITARGWFKVTDRRECQRFITEHSPRLDVFVGAAPRDRYEGGKDAISRVWCLWVDLDASRETLRDFRPQPTLIVRSGSPDCYHAYWALSGPLSPAWTERANRRLAYALGGDAKATDAARILRPPGTLNHKHEPPAKVSVAFVGGSTYPVSRVVGSLPDPPNARPVRTPRPDLDSDDPLAGVSAERYYTTLTGRPVTHGNVRCPFHGEGKERNPSMRLYQTTWFCWGCNAGGSVYEFGAKLWGLGTRGADFRELKERLTDALGQ